MGKQLLSGSATVPTPNAELDGVADILKDNPDRKIKIEAHTDGDGSASSNMTLSKNRANNTKAYLLQQGVTEAQIVSCDGYGEDQPIHPIPEKSASEKAANRRSIVVEV